MPSKSGIRSIEGCMGWSTQQQPEAHIPYAKSHMTICQLDKNIDSVGFQSVLPTSLGACISMSTSSETIPPELGRPTALQELHLHHNELTGERSPDSQRCPHTSVVDAGEAQGCRGLFGMCMRAAASR